LTEQVGAITAFTRSAHASTFHHIREGTFLIVPISDSLLIYIYREWWGYIKARERELKYYSNQQKEGEGSRHKKREKDGLVKETEIAQIYRGDEFTQTHTHLTDAYVPNHAELRGGRCCLIT
jgi:hypothetical protein